MKKITCLLFSFLLLVSLCSCTRINRPEKYTDTVYDLFDTVVTVTAYDESQSLFDEHFREFTDLLSEYDRLYDIYRSYDGINNLKTINDQAGVAPVEVDQKIIDLLNEGIAIYEKSEGKVNICMGSILSIWHEYREQDQNTLPSMQLLREAEKHTAIDALVLEGKTAYLSDKDASLDVGAIAKGYAAEQVCAYAKEHLWNSAVINIGGNVVTFGLKNGDNWNIAVDNPDEDTSDYLVTLSIRDKAIVTSADTQRYFIVNGKKYCHIIDPSTLFPASYMHSVTVVTDRSSDADALSTMLFNMPVKDGLNYINALDNTEAIFVDLNGQVVYSQGFEAYIKD